MKTLEEVKGLGPKAREALLKIGIETSKDLLSYYPFRYEILKRSDISTLKQDDKIIIDGIVETKPSVFYINSKLDKMNFQIRADNRLFRVNIFNRGFLKKKIEIASIITVVGKFDLKHNTITANDIYLKPLPKEPRIDPVYHSSCGISGSKIQGYINQILEDEIDVIDYIPEEMIEHYHFLSKEKSIYTIHNPENVEELKKAMLRMKYEELFLFMLKMNELKREKQHTMGLKRTIDYQLVDNFITKLPFSLTSDQQNCIKEIYHDLTEETRMNRLVQGDVGSGKTIVSFIAMYMNYLSGYQSALMAPTEILARQHYKNLKQILNDYPISIAVLTGKTKAKERKEILKGLEDGTIHIVIGTHALISENVTYLNLGLVITDEQHRFGVNQRSNLKNKGVTPDILYMSATPIPRTYALTIYGDMDVSNIHTMPNGRIPVITTLKKNTEIRSVLESMFQELKKGHQIYVIAPLIEESDKIDLENVTILEEKMKKAFGKFFEIGVLHGKMSALEKEEVMRKFEENEIQILISTTVIEVGVDVANATMMVIFDSDRFGLSALHQLRGRVGRNNLQSYCILISDREKERLSILTRTTDGFEISEEDFRLRGSGDLFGVRQSGEQQFQLANLKKDFSILKRAKVDSEKYIATGRLEKNTLLKEYLEGCLELS